MNVVSIVSMGAIVLACMPPCYAGDKTEERCEVLFASKSSFVEVDGLRVLSDAGAPEPLAVRAPEDDKVLSVRCFRSSAIPVPSDARVLDAGWPLNLVSVGSDGVRKIVVLEISNGQYRARVLDGSITNEEQAELVESLNAMQIRKRSE